MANHDITLFKQTGMLPRAEAARRLRALADQIEAREFELEGTQVALPAEVYLKVDLGQQEDKVDDRSFYDLEIEILWQPWARMGATHLLATAFTGNPEVY